jgi:hypothetical protein
MISIEIHSDADTEDDMVEMLRHIANQVEKGDVCNLDNPRWEISGEPEEPEDEG